VLNQIDIILL